MAFTENWGTAGTAGVYGWKFDATSAIIGTVSGTTGLALIGTGSLSHVYEYDTTGSYHANIELDASTSTTKIWRIKLYDGTDGTNFWTGLTNRDSLSTDYTKLHLYTEVSDVFTEVAVDTYANKSDAGWADWSISYSSGTWYGTLGPVTAGTTLYVSLGGYPAPASLTPRIISNDGGQALDYITFPFDRYTILDFLGTYNDGSTVGLYNFGDAVINIGNVTEYANTPLVTRGFSPSVSVTLDDAGSAWTNLIGNMINPTWITGTWFVRQSWDGGTNYTTLLTGQVNAEDVTYNVGEKTVDFTVNSTLKGFAEQTLGYDAHYTEGTAAGAQAIDSMTLTLELGTISSVGTDTREITFERNTTNYIHPDGGIFTVNFHDKEYLWQGTAHSGDSISIGSVYHKVGDENSRGTLFNEGLGIYSGTFSVPRIPDWMGSGVVMYYTRRWPDEVQIAGKTAYSVFGSNPAEYVKDVLYHMGMGTGAGWNTFGSQLNLWYTVQPQKFYYGGEKYVDILHHIAQSALFSYSTDAAGEFSGFVMAPTDGTSSKALDFNNAYNNTWNVGYTQPVNKVIVRSSWIESENNFAASHEIEGDSYPSSKTETIDAYWLDSDVYAEGHGVKIQRMYGDPLDQIVLEIEGTQWDSIDSGITVSMSGIPAEYPIYGTVSETTKDPKYYTVSGKNYIWADDILQVNLTRQLGGGWFRFNDSTFNGPDILW